MSTSILETIEQHQRQSRCIRPIEPQLVRRKLVYGSVVAYLCPSPQNASYVQYSSLLLPGRPSYDEDMKRHENQNSIVNYSILILISH